MTGKSSSFVKYLLLWAGALIWLFPGHLSVFPGNILFDPLSLLIILALGVVCLGARWREMNDPRLMFAALILLLTTALSFVGYLIKPAQGLTAFYRPAVATGTVETASISRRENGVDFNGHTLAAADHSAFTKIKQKVLNLTQLSFPYTGAVTASWEGYISIPSHVSHLELVSKSGKAELLLDNVVLAGNAQRIEHSGVYKISIRYTDAQANAPTLSLRWKAGVDTQRVPSEFLSPNQPNVIANHIAMGLQWLSLFMWVTALLWAMSVAKPVLSVYQWLTMGELMVLMMLPQQVLVRGGKKM